MQTSTKQLIIKIFSEKGPGKVVFKNGYEPWFWKVHRRGQVNSVENRSFLLLTLFLFHLFQLVMFHLPLTLYLAYFLEINIRPVYNKTSSKSHSHSSLGNIMSFLKKSLTHIVFVCLVLWQASSSYVNVLRAYGTLAFLLSPAKTWSVIFALYLFWRVHRPRKNN